MSYASFCMMLTPQTLGLAFDSQVLVGTLGGGLSSIAWRFPVLIGLRLQVFGHIFS
jgi:hypothetical protein